ncbi:MAG: transcriptional repressor LexA [Actinomycetota bacterium]
MEDLTSRQRRIIEYIRETVHDRGYPPTVREIGDAVGLTSSSSVHSQLANLERKGLITRDPTKPRAVTLAGSQPAPGSVTVPLIGRVAAGAPILATESIEDYLAVPEGYADGSEVFALGVVGDSMIDAGIFDGDVVVVRRQDDAADGDVVVALMPGPAEDEATVKRLRRRDGRVLLVPENPAMEPFEMAEGRIAGKVTAVLRKL